MKEEEMGDRMGVLVICYEQRSITHFCTGQGVKSGKRKSRFLIMSKDFYVRSFARFFSRIDFLVTSDQF